MIKLFSNSLITPDNGGLFSPDIQCARNKIISPESLISLIQPVVNVFVTKQMMKQITFVRS